MKKKWKIIYLLVGRSLIQYLKTEKGKEMMKMNVYIVYQISHYIFPSYLQKNVLNFSKKINNIKLPYTGRRDE